MEESFKKSNNFILKHLTENWIKYGFETLVVTVGILGAFALNNWNENRKQEILETQYLKGLKADLMSDTAYYNRRTSDSEKEISHYRAFVHLLYQQQNSIDDVQTAWSYAGWNSEHLTTQNSTYIELTNSGNLNIFQNERLKELIINYYRENERVATHIMEFNEVSSRHLIEVGVAIPNSGKFYHFNDDLYSNSDYFLKGEWDFMNDPSSKKFQTLEYALGTYKIKHSGFLNHFKLLKDLSVQLIKVIETELDARA